MDRLSLQLRVRMQKLAMTLNDSKKLLLSPLQVTLTFFTYALSVFLNVDVLLYSSAIET